jgi:hypothetical protein
VELLEATRLLEADLPRLGGRDESEIANEEDALLGDAFLSDPLQLAGEKR